MSAFKDRLAELGFADYAEYLRSPHWRSLRLQWCQTGRPQRCSSCRSKKFQLHHSTYERLGAESLDDLIALCRFCHKKTHKKEARGAPLSLAHEKVKGVTLRDEQYQQDRERARRKSIERDRKDARKRRALETQRRPG